MSHTCITEAPEAVGYDELLDRSFRRSYDEGRDIWSDEPAMEVCVQRLLARLPQRGAVLDVGAGRGRDAVALLGAGHRVDAVDLVATDDWAAIAKRWHGQTAFIEGDVLAVRLAGPYDGILDNGCLHHQHPSACKRYLAKLAAHAKPGATLVVSFFTPADGRSQGGLWQQHDGRLTQEFTEAQARALLHGAGWQALDCLAVPRASARYHYLVVTAEREMKPPSSLALATPRGGRPPTARQSRFRGGKFDGSSALHASRVVRSAKDT